MANFPTSPSIGDLFETKHDTFKWNGSGWEALGRILTHRNKSGTPYSSLSIKESGGVLSTDDTSTVLLVGETTTESPVKAAHSNDSSTSLLLQENVDAGLSESVSDANTKLLIGETIASGLSANTADASTSLLMNSNYDTSNSNHALTPSGNAKLVKGYAFYDEDWISTPSSSDFAFGTGDFTVECWIYNQDVSNSTQKGLMQISDNSGGIKTGYDTGFALYYGHGGAAGTLRLFDGTQSVITGAGTVKTDVWQHIAVTRESGTAKIFIDGKQLASGSFTSDIVGTNMAIGMYYGYNQGGWDYGIRGYMADIRISKGIARYTADFTTEITTKDASHKLILDGKSTDSSDSGHTLTFNNDAIEVSKIGGTSWKLDGSGDYLTVPDNSNFAFGTGDFTIELWINHTEQPGAYDLWAGQIEGGFTKIWKFDAGEGGTKPRITVSSSGTIYEYNATSAVSWNIGQWYHMALVRDGTEFKIFRDGTQIALTPYTGAGSGHPLGSNSLPDCSASLLIGGDTVTPATSRYFAGYIDSLRISKGTARYTSAFTPPTVPHTTDADTKLLLQGGPDSSDLYLPTFAGNAKMVTTPTKTAGHSMSFDGNDYITIPDSSDFDFSSSSFTIEMWVYFNSITGTNKHIFNKSWPSNGYEIYVNNANKILLEVGNGGWLPSVESNDAVTTNTWYHVAATYDGSTYKMYVDGVLQSDTTSSGTYPAYNSSYNVCVGSFRHGSSYGTDCYVNDLRVTKGAVRYTSNFYATDTNIASDKSSGLHSLTAVGDAAPSTAQKKFGTHSLYFDGGGDSIEIPDHDDFHFETGDFTIETWVKSAGNDADPIFFMYDGTTNERFAVYSQGTKWMWFVVQGGAQVIGANAPLGSHVADTWQHVALVRDSGVWKLFIDGVNQTLEYWGSFNSSTNPNVQNFPNGPMIGYSFSGSHWYLEGYMDDFRISNTARYTSNFVANYTATLVDNSSTGHTLTLNGDATLSTTAKKFGTHAIYFGGDGSGDYITLPNDSGQFDFGSNDFTIEAWIYPEDISAWSSIFFVGNWGSGHGFYLGIKNDGSPRIGWNGGTYTLGSPGDIVINQWQHIAFVRNGSNFACYVDGVAKATGTAQTINTTGNSWTGVGGYYDPAYSVKQMTFDGYMDDFRISDTARYTSNFLLTDVTLPTDKKGTHTLTLNGDALIASSGSSGETKFGTGAMEFDGTGDYITISGGNNLNFGTGDFTLEFWAKLDSITQGANETETIFCSETWYQSGNGGWAVNCDFRSGANKVTLYGTNGNPASGGSTSLVTASNCGLQANAWHHIAIVRSSGTVDIYVDGVSKVSSSWTFDMTQNLTHIGQKQPNWHYAGTTLDHLNGYLDEVRLSTSARYTANFTPQSVEHDLIDVDGWGSPILGSGERALFVNSNGLVMKSSDGTLTKMDSGSNAYASVAGRLLEGAAPSYDAGGGLAVHSSDVVVANGESFADTSGNAVSVAAKGSTVLDTSEKKVGLSSYSMPGAADGVTIADNANMNFGTGDYTIEMWFKVQTGYHSYLWTKHDSGNYTKLGLQVLDTGILRFLVSNTTDNGYVIIEAASHASVFNSAWHHAAVTRESGVTKVWLDGAKVLENSTSYNLSMCDGHDLTIGSSGNSWDGLRGWADEVHISNTCKYTASFTPDTTAGVASPPGLYVKPGVDSNTKLLLQMNGADDGTVFTDSSANSHVVTVSGNTVTKTAEKKFGTSSAYFDGTGDYLSIPDSSDWAFGTGDFTIEFWFHATSFANSFAGLVVQNPTSIGSADSTNGLFIELDDAAFGGVRVLRLFIRDGSDMFTEIYQTGISQDTWYHVAVVRETGANKITMYLNGASVGSSTWSGSESYPDYATPLLIGLRNDQTSYFQGYMDEIRISNTARYTENFTPSTESFDADGGLHYRDPSGVETKIS